MEITRAKLEEAATLTEVAFAAKRHWGYPEGWIQQWCETLTIAPHYIADNVVLVARTSAGVRGFGALQFVGLVATIDHLWVLPAVIGQGVGREIFLRLETEARKRGAQKMRLESDPHAEGFYWRMGFHTAAWAPAPIEGTMRTLPVMEKELV